jgi:hypothetical protein
MVPVHRSPGAMTISITRYLKHISLMPQPTGLLRAFGDIRCFLKPFLPTEMHPNAVSSVISQHA